MRIIQISDTHISAEHADFMANVAVIQRYVVESGADLVINTGDLSMNGCISPADLELARDFHASLGTPVLSVPGNHDVGDRADIRADQELDAARLEQFRAVAGDDFWTRDMPGWRLIGLNAMLFGTGHADEEAQFEKLPEAVATDAKIALFMHKPMFIDDPSEGPRGYWTVLPEPRRRLLDILGPRDVRLVASGHLHIARTLQLGATSHVWGPAASFVCGDMQEDLGGERRVGLVEHDFTPDGVTSRFVFPSDARDLPLDPVVRRLYPSPRSAAAE